MTPKPSQRAYEILQRVLDQDQSRQSAFLREMPNLDQNLRVEVELLLAQLRDFDAHTITSPTDLPADSAAPFPADARFHQRRKLGSGSFGIVYEAFDSVRGEAVAIKVLKDSCPEHLARFRDEFRAVEDVRHPNLVELGEFYSDNEVSFLTMELVRGRPFIEYVRPMNVPCGPCDVTRLASSLRQLCDGVNALHSANMMHRDLKPENVLVTEEGRVVILDFGLVFDLSPFGSYRSVAGSPAYMAPEQAAGRPERASDWFSVGVMLYEALTGVLPWLHRTASSVDRETARVPREIIGSISPDLSDLCMELISEVPSRRPSVPPPFRPRSS
jgi:serine/threonine protein kinase